MAVLVTDDMRHYIATQFYNAYANTNSDSLYVFIGQQRAWANDASPQMPQQSVFSYKTSWDNMLAGKKITSQNISLVIPRINWVSNTVYTAYTDLDAAMADTTNRGYVLNTSVSPYRVYKCLANNATYLNGLLTANSTSIVAPTTISLTNPEITSDGYKWKYMFSVVSSDSFLNSSWVPVPLFAPPASDQLLIQQNAINGGIQHIQITNPGAGYANSSNAYIVSIVGDGVGANAYANVINGMITNIVIVDYGREYTRANVTIIGSNTSTATANAIMSPIGGHGYSAAKEFRAHNIMISLSTTGIESGYFTTNNQFRQVGLLLNPSLLGSNNVSTNTLVTMSTSVIVAAGFGTFTVDETVYQGISLRESTFSGVVIDFDPITNLLRLNNIKGTPTTAIIAGTTSGAERYFLSSTSADLKPYSGQILYIDNILPVTRSTSQTENFKFVIKTV